MKVQNNEILMIIEYFLNNFIFEMFSHSSHFNKKLKIFMKKK